jgi:hypothetical protein
MEDERIIHLLEEIRDLQKQHIENYRSSLRNQELAMQNQERAIEISRSAVRRQKITLIVVAILFVALLGVPTLLWMASWATRR